MIRREFAEWQLWLRGQIVELEDYTRQMRKCAYIAIYRCAMALEQTACDITKQIETAERKHEQRARRR